MVSLLDIVLTFAKIGLLSFGGGYAGIPIVEVLNKLAQRTKKKEKKRKKYLDEIVDGILDFIEKYGGGAKMALKNIRVHYLEGFWKITDEDAAECAVKYGRACAGVNVILAFIQNYIRIEKIKLKIYPDFASEKDEIRIKADIEFNPLIVIIGLLRIATVFFKDIFFKQHKTEKMKVKECI